MRALLVGTPLDNSGYWAAAWSVALIVISVPITTWLFRRRSSR
jgi:ABC-2 type transport system permease protein